MFSFYNRINNEFIEILIIIISIMGGNLYVWNSYCFTFRRVNEHSGSV